LHPLEAQNAGQTQEKGLIKHMADLTGKVAIVVGASSGMGEATARTYAAAGAKVVLAARSGDKLAALAEELGENALACTTDARDAEAARALVEQTMAVFGRVDILAYVTGTNIPDRALQVLTEETWEMMLGTNLTGAFHCTKAALPVMREQRAGLIIYVSSGCVQKPDASGVSYQATKHGMVGLAHGTFQEEKENGVRTCVIFPGLTDTPLVLKRPVPTPPEVVAQALMPQDVADACLFVAALPARAYVPELVLLPAGLS
jgi:NADP-dependent 3-hydroxy acid dehydrogenase YdfG|tara:strand:+ start:249 stop:1028 length:780 start_codon:yes stop_codon:yes gene_type:complete